MPGVPQFAKVSEGLYRGGQPTEQGFIALKRIGVKTIVSLRVLDSDREFVDSIGLNHLHLSVKHLHPEDEDVLAFLKVATDTANQPVFVHCRDGVDRTGMMVAVYRILVQDWSKQDAIEEMRSMGFNEIWDQIEDYIEELDVDRMKRELRRITAPDEEAPN